jgi:peroxiredoxin-like protein
MDATYRVSVTWMNNREGWGEAEGVKDAVKFSAPPEFGGRPGFWSPEQLLVLAANSCFLSSFLFFADRSRVSLAGYRADAEGRLERVQGRGFHLAEITLRPVVVLEREADMDRARQMLEKAERACIISNSLKTAVRVEPRLEVLQQAKSA